MFIITHNIKIFQHTSTFRILAFNWQDLGDGQATKLIIPSDLAGLGGVFAALKEMGDSVKNEGE